MKASNLSKKLKSFAARVLFEQESAVLDFTEQIVEAMQRRELTKAELADRLGKSRAHVTQILRGDNNFTFQTAVSLAVALGLRFKVTLEAENSVESGFRPIVTMARESELSPTPAVSWTAFPREAVFERAAAFEGMSNV